MRKPENPRRKLQQWRWSFRRWNNDGESLSTKNHGNLHAIDAMEVLDAVSADEGANGRAKAFETWDTGGWAQYDLPPSQGGGTVTVVVTLLQERG